MKEQENKPIQLRLSLAKEGLSNVKFPKSGENKYLNFKYHELQDFLPYITKANAEHGICDVFTFNPEHAKLKLMSTDNASDSIDFIVPFVESKMLGKGGSTSNVDPVQRLGATLTYLRRYLYIIAYNISEGDVLDAQDTRGEKKAKPTMTDDKLDEIIQQVKDGKITLETFNQGIEKYELTIKQQQLILKSEL